MKEKILNLLNIKPHETFLVKYLFFIQFFLGMGLAILSVAASYIFLHATEIKNLTWIYFAAGISLIFINYIYSYVEHHYTLKNAFKWSILLAIASVFLFALLINKNSHGFSVFFLLLWYHLIYYLCNSGFWGIASIVFNVREGRRVFSLIGSGDIPAKMLGYLSVSVIAPLVGTNNLLWVSVLCFVIAFVVTGIFLKNYNIEEEEEHEGHHQNQHAINVEKEIKSFFNNPLVLFIGLSTIIFAASTVVVDYTFLSEVKLKYFNDSSLISFLSIFFAWSRLIAIAVKILLSAKIQNKLGIKGTLFVLPATILLFSIGIISFSALNNMNVILYFFGMLMVFTEVLKSTIYEPMFFVLFQPLRPSERLRGHNITKGIMLPIGYILMSAGLAIYLHYYNVLLISSIVSILMVLSLIWLVVIVFIEKNYYQQVRNAISKNSFFNFNQTEFIKENTSFELFDQKLHEGQPIEKVTAIQYLLKIDKERAMNEMRRLLNKEEHDVVLNNILDVVVQEKWYEVIPKLKALLTSDEQIKIKGKILKVLCTIDGDNFNEYYQHSMGVKEFECECISGALKSENLSAIINAGQILIQKLNSLNKEEKMEALRIIEDTENPILYKQIQLLLNEKDETIKRKILESIIKIKNPVFLEYIIANLNHEQLKLIAEKCMISYADIWIKDLHNIEKTVDKEKLIEYLVKSNNEQLYDVVLDLFYESPNMSITNYLYKKKRKLDNNDYILKLIQKQIHKMKQVNSMLHFCDDEDIRRALKNEYKDSVTESMQLMYLLNDSNKVSDIYFILLHEKESKYPEAMELLEYNTKKHHLSELLKSVEIFTENGYAQQKSKESNKVCNEILDNELMFNDWTIALSLYKLRGTNMKVRNKAKIVQELLNK